MEPTPLPNLLLLTQMFPPAVGGSGVLLQNIYSRVTQAPVEVWTPTAGAATQATNNLIVKRVEIDGRHWGVRRPAEIYQHVRLARAIGAAHQRSALVVHCSRAQPEGIPAMLAAYMGGPRFVFWVHGEEVTTALISREFAWTMRRVHRAATLAIANSHNSARVLEGVGFRRERIRVVHPGVDDRRFSPDVDGAAIRRRFAGPGDILLLSVGRLQRRKGHDVVLTALRLLRARLSHVRYVIVGDGDERHRLETLAQETGLCGRVFFEGEVPWAMLPQYFAAADVFVLPTRVDAHDFEGFGLVFLEAAAAGLPTIGGHGGGVAEAVEEGVTGMLVDGTDPGELARAIAALAGSHELRQRFGQAGRSRAVTQFSWETAASAVTRIHAEVAALK
jgi:phosphatidylinositol alpha-1,6-mannosyltransferase